MEGSAPSRQVPWEGLMVNAMGSLTDPDLPAGRGDGNGDDPRWASPRVLDDLAGSGLAGLTITLGRVGGGGDAYRASLESFGRWEAFLEAHEDRLAKVLRAGDIPRAREAGKVGLVLSFQDATPLEGDPGRLEAFHARGLRVAQLTYNGENAAGGGCMSPERGLTPFGRALLARQEALGILVDLSHAGRRTFADALEACTRPPCATHTGCRALAGHPRNLDDDQLRRLAERGGVAGIYAMPFLVERGQQGAADLLRHLEHALEVCGEDHVGVGTDLPAAAPGDPGACLRALREELEARRRAGISAPGERADALHYLPDLPAPALFRGLGRLLAARGHGPERIGKVLGGNFLRIYREAWG